MSHKVAALLLVVLLAGCAEESVKNFQAKVDNNFQSAEIAVDPSLAPSAKFSQLNFTTLFNQGTYGLRGHVVFNKRCGMLQIGGKFLGPDGATLAAGSAIVSSYDKDDDRPFEMLPSTRLSTGMFGAKIGKILVTSVSCL